MNWFALLLATAAVIVAGLGVWLENLALTGLAVVLAILAHAES